jgi:hypothetical protein
LPHAYIHPRGVLTSLLLPRAVADILSFFRMTGQSAAIEHSP